MTRASRERFQVNVALEDEHWHIALLQLAIRDAKSVPEVLRPVIVAYLKRQLATDEQLAAAVASMEAARSGVRDRSRRRRNLAEVRAMASSQQGRRKGTSAPGRRQHPS